MKHLNILVVAFCLLANQAKAFAPHPYRSVGLPMPRDTVAFAAEEAVESEDSRTLMDIVATQKRGFFGSRIASVVAGWVSGLCGYVTRGMAEDLEYAELPPPYVPALFGVVLLAGVGILTASLGDVMDEEASLGLQSGARAKKEIERSRSSYFKKR